MAYSLALNAIYNQYLTTYAPKKSDTRYDTHKKSELKGITNSMAKVNKDAPLYKIDTSPEANRYIIGIKEETRQLQNTIASVIGDSESTQFDSKIAYSSDENIATAKYVGQNETLSLSDMSEDNADGTVVMAEQEIPSYNIEVQSLASAQVNMGKFLPKETRDIPAGDYTFDMSVNGQGYEFQYTIREEDTNFDIQNRLSRLINNSNIHLNSTVEEDGQGNSSLRIESAQVGVHYGENSRVFNIADAESQVGSGSVEYLGIGYIAREASNAHFTVNGMEASASSNTFVLEKNYEITLNGVSPEEGIGATIGVKPNTEAAVENISNLIGGYNQFIRAMSEYSETQAQSNTLIGEMKSIAGYFSNNMEKLGITINTEGTMDIDEKKLSNAILDEDSEQSIQSLKQFSGAMVRKSRQVSLNPISYVNKTVVEYKNPGKSFSSPYVASAYAGMMFNSYC
ncbi:MAG: flagellar filament capping protein FliD [Lachnospiraceae bacterium]|nr:flagellar filament capping protein FliD [Candidatus Colinaster scatohippi]